MWELGEILMCHRKAMDSLASQPQSVLVVLMGALGDLVRGLSIVRPIKEASPSSTITWLSDSRWAPVVRLHPDIDHVILFNRKVKGWGVRSVVQELRSGDFDLTLDLQRHLKSGLCSWFSGSKRRIGFHKKDSKEGNYLFNNERINEYGERLPKIEHYWKFLEHLGVSALDSPVFGFEEYAPEDLAGDHLKKLDGDYMGIVLGSSWESKDWLPSGYQRLVKLILENSSDRVALFGDGSMVELGAAITSTASSDRVCNLVGGTSLVELVGLIKGARIVIGPDSGPGHIAGAVGTRYVSLFGPTAPIRVAPYGSEDLVLQSPIGCAPCYQRKCPGLDRLCMRLLTAESVWDRVCYALDGGRDVSNHL